MTHSDLGKVVQKLLNKYRLLNLIHEGCDSQLYEAVQRQSGKSRVLKSICSLSKDSLERGVNELKYLNLFKGHPNILRLKTQLVMQGRVVLITQHCRGGDLLTFLLDQKKLTQFETGLIIKQLAFVLCHIHSRKIVHSDLRPENILLQYPQAGCLIKLSGFDQARPVATVSSIQVSSPLYLAPQVLQGRAASCAQDVWSLGIILFMMLTGTSFLGGEDVATTCKLLSELTDTTIKAKLDFWTGKLKLSPEVSELLSSMLKHNPEKRITMKEVKQHRWVQQNGWLSEEETTA